MPTKIKWCDETINPIVGCTKISSGCKNCYAERMARRLANMGLQQYKEVTDTGYRKSHTPFGGWNSQVCFVRSELEKPYKRKKPRTIFVGSMGDVFHESVPLAWIAGIFTMIFDNPRHTFILLTKRPDRMLEMCTVWSHLKNLVIGVSVENQTTADARIPILLQTPAAKRFISIEPMIGPVDLNRIHEPLENGGRWESCLDGKRFDPWSDGCIDGFPRLDGVILGGESGNKSRPLHPEWVRMIRDQCSEAGVPFMFKQWGNNVVQEYVRKWEYVNENGFPMLDGNTHTELAWDVR